LFWTLAVLIAWILAGWPVWLYWRSRRSARPTRCEPIEPSVTVLLCVRNGETYLRRKLDTLLALDYPSDKLEIFVIDNQSSDSTCAIANSYAGRGVRLLSQPTGGKAEALNLGMSQAQGELLLITDVRQPLEKSGLRHIASRFADPSVGVVSGELRIVSGDNLAERSVGAYWRFETWIRARLSELDSMLGATGPYYAIRRSLALPLRPGTLLDDVCLPLGAFFAGYRLVMEDRAIAYDYPTSASTEFRRKVRTLAGNYQLLWFFPQLLGPSNRLWLDYFSYKLGRLILPFLLIGLLVSSFSLKAPLAGIALGLQGTGYGLALLDFIIPEGMILKKITAPARVFLTMMTAALCALSVFILPAGALWKPTQTAVRNLPEHPPEA
jgi:biofilm PGA synthesis N-glycosyltransferase PgaC